MKRLHVAELLTVLAVLAFVLWPRPEPAKVVVAPESKPSVPNPACATMRNETLGAPYLPEPNRDDMRKAQLLWGGDSLVPRQFRLRPQTLRRGLRPVAEDRR